MSAPILQYFTFAHLPAHLRDVSYQFTGIAQWVDESLPDGPEKTVCLRKLLEAKDAGVRSALALATKDAK